MEYFREKLGDNINLFAQFLDWDTYSNLLLTQKTDLKLLNKNEYFKKNVIGWDKFDLAWKNENQHWNLITTTQDYFPNYIDKFYRLKWVWWFELSYTFTNLKGPYRFVLFMSKGTLERVHYMIFNNGQNIKSKIDINLTDYSSDTKIKIKTDYVDIKFGDLVRVVFYETNSPKENIEIYYIEPQYKNTI